LNTPLATSNNTCPADGSCALGFQIQGLPYLFFMASPDVSKKKNRSYFGIGEFLLLLGRIGRLVLTLGTALDSGRLLPFQDRGRRLCGMRQMQELQPTQGPWRIIKEHNFRANFGGSVDFFTCSWFRLLRIR
jgi:hypothetical protein